MFNTRKVLNILSFHLPIEITLQNKVIAPGPLTMIRKDQVYNFYRYEVNADNTFSPQFYGFILVPEGSSFFEKTFNVDLIEEADINL